MNDKGLWGQVLTGVGDPYSYDRITPSHPHRLSQQISELRSASPVRPPHPTRSTDRLSHGTSDEMLSIKRYRTSLGLRTKSSQVGVAYCHGDC